MNRIITCYLLLVTFHLSASPTEVGAPQNKQISDEGWSGYILPGSMSASISWRPAYEEPNPDDLLVSFKAMYDRHTYRLGWERENGDCFLNYAAYGKYDLSEPYYWSWKTEVMSSKGINWQTLMAMWRSPWLVDAGVNVTSHAYSDPQGAVSFACPLPGEGSVIFTTDFDEIHVWDANTLKYLTPEGSKVRPYIEVHYFSENGDRYYRGEVGVEFEL